MHPPDLTREQALHALVAAAADLTADLSADARYQRLVTAVKTVFPCDAAAVLTLRDAALVPAAITGLLPETLGQVFVPSEHPRLAAILASEAPLLLPADETMPDPYDGLVQESHGHGLGDVHSCMGCALRVGGEVVGVLTLDALEPGAFDGIDAEVFQLFAALAAAAVQSAEMIAALRRAADRQGRVAHHLLAESMRRGGGEILGRSAAMVALRREIQTVAESDLTALVTGETGTGKELVARTIHARSGRSSQPLIYINCAALPESIAESELFGHVRGAFSGAVRERMGKFELADGGTLFLDEIGEMPLSVQPMLLRALQFGEIQRVGSDRQCNVDVRVIAATNRDLAAAVEAQIFRSDLFHRLSVYPIPVPPLREHIGDVPLLTGHFLDQARVRMGKKKLRLSAEARDALVSYDWPGNVRELEHVIARAAVRAARADSDAPVITIQTDQLSLNTSAPPVSTTPAPTCPDPVDFVAAVAAHKSRLIRDALDRSDGNWAEAARDLGLDRSNLHRLARRLGLR
jgi:anaerobic nitric oxide reductase transcription regulator